MITMITPSGYFNMKNIGGNPRDRLTVPDNTFQVSGWEGDQFIQFFQKTPVIVENTHSHANITKSSLLELNFTTDTGFTLLVNSITVGSQPENSEPKMKIDDLYLKSDKCDEREDTEIKSILIFLKRSFQ